MSESNGAWRPVDCHAHSTFSDGRLSPADVAARGAALGVVPSVSDHASRDVRTTLQSVAALERYLDALERHDVLRGAEFCWHDTLWRELPPEVASRFTHTIGSLHAIDLGPAGARAVRAGGYRAGVLECGVHMFQRRWPEGLDVDTYMDAHVASLEQFAREMPVDILAHPTLLPLQLRERPLEELWTEEREDRAVRALAAAGIVFEVSSRYRPHERFVRRAFEAGVRLSLGSDGHTAEQVGDVTWSLALTRAVGVPDEALYDPRTHGSRAGAWDLGERSAAR